MKPQTLRELIANAYPELARDRERFGMWIDKGKIRATNAETRGFEWAYTLHIAVVSFTAHPSVMFMIICDWLRTNQPELLAPTSHEALRFETDIVDDKTVDLMVEMDLTEVVRIGTTDSGETAIEHVTEPTTFLPDDDAPLSPSTLKRLLMNGDLILPGPPNE